MTPEEYNYGTFPPADEAETLAHFPEWLKVGRRAPDPALRDLDGGSPIYLSDYTRQGYTIVEFGSLT